MIKYLSGTTGVVRKVNTEEGTAKGEERLHEGAREREGRQRTGESVWGVIIKVTRTPIKRLTSRSQTSPSNAAE